jgi:hypothetical protein
MARGSRASPWHFRTFPRLRLPVLSIDFGSTFPRPEASARMENCGNKSQPKSRPKHTAAADAHSQSERGHASIGSVDTSVPRLAIPAPALLQHDILLQVLLSCVPDPSDAISSTAPGLSVTSSKPLRVPGGVSWLASAARTCKAWLEPALHYLYRILYLHQIRIPTPLERVAPRVRTLVIELDFQETETRFQHLPPFQSLHGPLETRCYRPEANNDVL